MSDKFLTVPAMARATDDTVDEIASAEQALERVRSGDERTVPLKSLLKRHGVDD